jgi:hypothetical protein
MSCVTIAAESAETALSADRRKALNPSVCMRRGAGDVDGLGTEPAVAWDVRRGEVE